MSAADAVLAHMKELEPAISGVLNASMRNRLINSVLPDMLRREVEHRGLLRDDASLATQPIAWVEMT